MNGHDGNISPIEVAARSAKVAHKDFKIVSMNAWWYTIGDCFQKTSSRFGMVWGKPVKVYLNMLELYPDIW